MSGRQRNDDIGNVGIRIQHFVKSTGGVLANATIA